MEVIITEKHIDDLMDSLDDIHLYEPDIVALTEEEYQALLDAQCEDAEREEEYYQSIESDFNDESYDV